MIGASKLSEHGIWCAMRNRCNNPKNLKYYLYGGRGIKVCDEWERSFDQFYADMGPRPTRQHSIDRIDNDGDYEPGNCRWATEQEQHDNNRRSITIEQYDQIVTLLGRMQQIDIARTVGVSEAVVSKVKSGVRKRPKKPMSERKNHE